MRKTTSSVAAILLVLAMVPVLFSCGGDGPKIKKTPSGYVAYTDEVNHFKLAHPEEWKLTPFKDRGSCTISMPGAGAFFVKVRKAYSSETMGGLKKNFDARMKMWGDKLVMHRRESTTLSGKSAELYNFTMKSKYGDKTQYVVFALAGGRYYEIIFDGRPKTFEKVKGQIRTIVDTFHITK